MEFECNPVPLGNALAMLILKTPVCCLVGMTGEVVLLLKVTVFEFWV
jgi:hypothetical protein